MKLDSTGLIAAAALFAAIMPSLSDVRRAHVGSPEADDVRNGAVVGGAVLVGIGALLAARDRSSEPLYMLGGVAVLIVAAFELTLRSPGGPAPTAEPGPRVWGRYGM